MKKDEINKMTIGEIVAQDYRAASIFKQAGIDFCCGGKKSIDETCSEKGIDPAALIEKVNELNSTPNTASHNFNEWDPGFLCDYIVNTHHKYVMKAMPELLQYTQKISSVHHDRHPELNEVAKLFSDINHELIQHLKNEEEVLFPAIKDLLNSGSEKSKPVIVAEIERLSGEHEFAGGAMDKINELTHNYMLPPDSCNTYNVTFELLKQFEDDLHTHVHLENNILFPKALKSTY